MIVKTIPYHDLDGDLREDSFYFSMNETQFARVNSMFPGGLQNYALKAAKDKDADAMFKVIDTLVREAYGERVNNGFIKVTPNGQKLSDFFINTEAYDNLLLELMQSEDNLMTFLTGCLNTNARERVQNEFAKLKNTENSATSTPVTAVDEKPSLSVLENSDK